MSKSTRDFDVTQFVVAMLVVGIVVQLPFLGYWAWQYYHPAPTAEQVRLEGVKIVEFVEQYRVSNRLPKELSDIPGYYTHPWQEGYFGSYKIMEVDPDWYYVTASNDDHHWRYDSRDGTWVYSSP